MQAMAALSVTFLVQVPAQLIATSVAGGAGAAALAAHTVVRQLFEFWAFTFTAFNIATQALVAKALAKASPLSCTLSCAAFNHQIADAHGTCSGTQGLKTQAREILVRALELGALLGVAVGVSQALWCLAPTGGAAGMFTREPTVLAASNAVLLLIYFLMVRLPETPDLAMRSSQNIMLLSPCRVPGMLSRW